jgi:transmembrane sensor
MSNVSPLVSREERSEQASIWAARLERGLVDDELDQLNTWLALDHRNREELLSLAALWDQMDSLSRLSDVIPRTRKQASRKQLAIAASFAVIVSLSAWLLTSMDTVQTPPEIAHVQNARYETPIGDRSTIHLKDGSVVQLNTDTRLDVSMLVSERRLTLERGEIHIDVAHDPDRPLRVIAGNRVVEAIGTSFNIRIDESQEIEVIVTDGKVRVEIGSGSDGDNQHVISTLAENQRVRVDNVKAHAPDVLRPDEIEVRLSWRKGNLIFRGDSLGAAVSEVGRYTDVEFVIQSDELKRLRVAGLFKAGDVEGFLASLRTNLGVVDQRVDDKTILLSRPSAPPAGSDN